MAEWFDQDTQQWYSTETEQWNPIEVDEEIQPPEEGYVPPSWADIGFDFTPGGYTAPPWSEIPFEWFGAITQSFNIGASITGNLPYTDAPYCTIKRSNIIALGFGAGGWQILKGRTEYTCMYDLNAVLTAVPTHADLGAYIFAFTTFKGEKDLGGIISGWAEKDLGGIVYGVPPKDLAAYLKAAQREYADLGAYIRAWHIFDLQGIIGVVYDEDLPAFIRAVGGKDLSAYIKAYPEEDLPAQIYGWAVKDLGAFVSIHERDTSDLTAYINTIHLRDLNAIIRGWHREVPFGLGAIIQAFNFKDLPAIIRAKEFGEIWASIYGIPAVDLPAFLHGWQEVDLAAIIISKYGPDDLQAQILGIGPKDLPAIIEGIRRGMFDLPVTVFGWAIKDLPAIIEAQGGTKDLPASIFADGYLNLRGIITPRVVKFSTLLPVHTMEARNLSAVINLQPCFNFSIQDLGAYLKALYKGDLTATIYGFKTGDYSAQLRDLGAFISTEPLNIFPTTTDSLLVNFIPTVKVFAFDDLPISFWGRDHYPMDELDIEFIPGGGRKIPNQLNAYINPTPMYHDLMAYINGVIQMPYEFRSDGGLFVYEDLTSFTAPYILNNMELFSKLVNIRFLSTVYDYFYQSAASALWKENSLEEWVLEVTSWDEEEEFFGEKRNEKRKVVDGITEFESVDEAIRYALDWVLAFPQRNLTASITGSIHPLDKLSNLSAYINSGGKIYSDAKNLPALMQTYHALNMSASMCIYGNGPQYGGQQYRDMTAWVNYPPYRDMTAWVNYTP